MTLPSFAIFSLAALSTPAPGEPVQAIQPDIGAPVNVFPYPMWMVWTAAGILAVLLGMLIWWVVRWVRRRPAPPPPTPRAAALSALASLRPQVETLEPYGFSFAVSDVLRTYIGAEYRLHAPQQTSPEFLATITNAEKFSDADRTLLAAFLERCDLIKFARADADVTDSARLLDSAVSFVQGGRP